MKNLTMYKGVAIHKNKLINKLNNLNTVIMFLLNIHTSVFIFFTIQYRKPSQSFSIQHCK